MRKRWLTVLIVLLLILSISAIDYRNVLPSTRSNNEKPIILYYDPFNLKPNLSSFHSVASYAIKNHFNTLMLVIYAYHSYVFDSSTITAFQRYAESVNLTFVPSFYIISITDTVNVSGYKWVNLDMELLPMSLQRFYYARIMKESPLVSVTSPYGQALSYTPEMSIVETYSGVPLFWAQQLFFNHSRAVCSISPRLLSDQTDYNSEFDYCLDYSRGVMVFDYFNLVGTNFSTP